MVWELQLRLDPVSDGTLGPTFHGTGEFRLRPLGRL